jgi:hypothetical protein
MDPIRTGAARIALGGRAAGAEGVVILPVGLTFPDKVALRPSALVQLGQPIELDVVVPPGTGPDDQQAVRQLTAVIDRGLRAVSPDFPDLETALALEQAAQIALSSPADPDPSLEERYELARSLGRLPEDQQAELRRQVGRYTTVLSGLHLRDADVVAPTNPVRLVRSVVGLAVIVVLLGSVVAATALVNVWPTALVILTGQVVKAPVSKGTYRAIVGLLAFPTAWITAAVLRVDGALAVTAVALACAIGALAAIVLVERTLALTRMILRWQAQRERIVTTRWAEEIRAEVVEAVRSTAPGARQ